MIKPLGNILVIGGVALDITATAARGSTLASVLHTSTPGWLRHTLGGVGRNVCEAAVRTGATARLVSVTGDDMSGKVVRQSLKDIGMSEKHIQLLPGHRTAVYNALHSADGQLVAAIADMDIFDMMNAAKVADTVRAEKPSIVCIDGNIPVHAMASVTATCAELGTTMFFEPTSVPKSLKVFSDPTILDTRAIKFVSPNQYELEAMSDAAQARIPNPRPEPSIDLGKVAPPSAQAALPYGLHLAQLIPNIVTKLGQDGCLFIGRSERATGPPVIQYFAPEQIDNTSIKSVTGAGDSFVGALLANLQRNIALRPDDRHTWREIITRAQRAAVLTLQSDLAVSPRISNDLLFHSPS